MRAQCGTPGFNSWVMGAEVDHLPLRCELSALGCMRKHNLMGSFAARASPNSNIVSDR